MTEPTGPARNSSLRIVKAPGKSFSCREAQTVMANIVLAGPFRHAHHASDPAARGHFPCREMS